MRIGMGIEMASGNMSGVKRFLLWEYPRASWQYDLIVGLIVAFIFLTPRGFFQDQPRASSLVRVPVEQGADVFFVETELLDSVPEPQRSSTVENMVKQRYGKRETVFRIEPIHGNEREIKGYLAYAKP